MARFVPTICVLILSAAVPRVLSGEIDFQRQIRPIFSENCYQCHGPDEAGRKSPLRLDRRESALAEHDGKFAIVPGKAAESEIFRRLTSEDADERMPPADSGRRLTAEQVELVRKWIEEGAPWKEHWAFVAPVASPPPSVGEGSVVRNPIDSFVLDRLSKEEVAPSAEAPAETLARRVTLDLTGLPPTIEELDRYLADESPDKYDRLVDRLLASPRYGERMAAPWLDAARYSDTNGYQEDRTRTMWPWRDWLIDALNRNMPFDAFTIEQTAGDLLPNATVEQQLATGFHRNHMLNGEGGRIAEESRVEYVFDRVETTGTLWLGLTIGCCRCHDHKYDPIGQKEYYRLFAYFNSIDEVGGVDRGGNANPVVRVPTGEQSQRRMELVKEIESVERDLAERKRERMGSLTDAARHLSDVISRRLPLERRLRDAKQELAKLDKSMTETMVLQERGAPRETYLLVRGAYDKPDKSETLEASTPSVLPGLPAGAAKNRLTLARWLVDPANPLTSRVTVNRAWQTFFGAGLVRTPEDFGSQGEPPSHPELLDWLAVEFPARGWDVKELHRILATSATYRQSSSARPELLERDPQNRLLARGPRFRLSSMALRDQALAVSGLLVDTMGGPGVNPYQPDDVWTDFSLGKIKYQRDNGASLYRRSVYVFWRRSVGPTMFFDAANRQVCAVRPQLTNTPLHALTLMNDTAYVEAARVLAERVIREAGPSQEDRIGMGFRLATGRRAKAAEIGVLTASLARSLSTYRSDPEAAKQLLAVGEWKADATLDPVELAAYAATMSVVLNLDETQTKE